jgi:hypothetical protein
MKNQTTVLFITICLLISLSCSYDITPPEITSYSPSNGTVVAQPCPVIIHFSKSMDKDVTQKSFSLLYGEYGDSLTEGNFSWENNDKTLIFSPEISFKNGYYRLVIDKSAQDKHNNTLTKQHISYFIIGQDVIPPEVRSIQPADCSENIPLNNSLVILFSESMNTVSVQKNIRISPSIDYIYAWDSLNTTLTIIPHSPLLFNTWYQLELSPECADIHNNAMVNAFTSRFRTGIEYIRPTITGLYMTSIPNNMASSGNFQVYEGANINDTLTISFNEPIDTSTILKALSFSPSITWNSFWENSNQTCTIHFTQPLLINTQYELIINSNLKDISNNSLLEDLCIYFVTNGINSQPPSIIQMKCIDTSEGEKILIPNEYNTMGNEVTTQNNTYTFAIQFSTDILRHTVPDNIKIEFLYGEQPEDYGIIGQYQWIGGSQDLRLTINAIEGGNVYKLLIKGGSNGIQSINGVNLQDDVWYLFYFNPMD